MNSDLTVTDPLLEQEVTILITLPASDQTRDQRPVLISLGVAEQLPVSKSGLFGEITALIAEAWTAFAVRVQATEVIEDKTMVASQVVAITNIEEDEPPAATPRQPTPPKPQAQNLSLF